MFVFVEEFVVLYNNYLRKGGFIGFVVIVIVLGKV